MSESQYIIGIDLGTTNCTMAYLEKPLSANRMLHHSFDITQFSIPQMLADGVIGEKLSLPSFAYLPLEREKEQKSWATALSQKGCCVGVYARDRGSEMPGRLVSSAKSWLCHDGVNRREKLLPIDADQEKMSPVEASAEYLGFLRDSWNQKFPESPFCEQTLLVTVPASFDPDARQLVSEAAQEEGLGGFILLEEPQAAFYSWLHRHSESWRDTLGLGERILVVDIGGGTTDFSLIATSESEGDLQLERLAVGSHLLLGGDNMDLSLAYHLQAKLEEEGHEIDDWQMASLVHSVRAAKESLLGGGSAEQVDVVIPGRGSGLIGGAVTCSLTLDDVTNIILDGFFPLLSFKERAHNEKRSGIRQMGLPYVSDPRMTCQLSRFLSSGEEDFIFPTAVLFNGGVLKSVAIQNRLKEVLDHWAQELCCDPVKILDGPDYDFAVGRGAVYYGVAREGQGIRIKSGVSKNYFIGVEDAAPAVPGLQPRMKAVCVVPFGMEEGEEKELLDQKFSLSLGESAIFRFFSEDSSLSPSEEGEDAMGKVVRNTQKLLTELHPIETLLEKKEEDGSSVCVRLKSKVTELGVLELWCVSQEGKEWKLEFDLRKEEELESIT